MKFLYTSILLFITCYVYAQTLVGKVVNESHNALENANVMAKPLNEEGVVKFVLTDYLGRYKLELEKETNYVITVNYIGYEGGTLDYFYEKPISDHNFALLPKEEVLEEIVINYDYQPIIVKKDTIVYDVAAFMNGNERKLKHQLSKLPGVEVTDKGQVKVQGKTVTQFLVEGNTFFGGGTKLGVENIPADAVERVEVIDHFTQVGHMKEVSGSDDLAMNIKLKEDKKKFIFGDLRLGYGTNNYYDTNATTFYYSPTFNWSLIANANNFGSQQLTYDDISRIEGFKSVFVRSTINQKQLINLYRFLDPNTDVVENKNQFIASDLRYAFIKKWDVKALFLMNKNWIRTQTNQSIQYLQAEDVSFENRWNTSKQKDGLFSGKLSADYRKNKNTTFNYNIQLAATNNIASGDVLSETDRLTRELNTQNDVDNFGLSQLFEFHKTFNKKQKASFAFVHTFNKETPQYEWYSNQSFLGSYVPWQNTQNFGLKEIKEVTQHKLQINAKHYWLANKKHHVYTTFGFNGTYSNVAIKNEFLNSNAWENLNDFGFGNQLKYQLNNPFLGIEYRFIYKKFTSILGAFLQFYHLKNQYTSETNTFSSIKFEPDLKLEYEFNSSEKVQFNYVVSNSYLGAENYTNRWQVNSFNTLFKGNAILQNVQYHQAVMHYSKFNMYSGINAFGSLSFNKKNKNIRNQVSLIGIDQFYETVMSDQPDTNWDISGYLTKRVKKIELNSKASFGFNRYTQVVNDDGIDSKRDYQMIGAGFKTLFKENPNIELSYSKTFSQLESSFDNKSTAQFFSVKTEVKFLQHFLWKTDYNWMSTVYEKQNTNVKQLNTYLEFHKKDSQWLFMVKGNNLFNTGLKKDVNFSDFIISNTNTYILPRVVLLSVQYKL